MIYEYSILSIGRWVLGLLILIFGANGLFHFIPVPQHPPKAECFRQALIDAKYMLPLWKGIEFVGALLLLINLWVPFALIILAPVLINIFLFHLFLSPKGLWLACLLIFCEVILIWGYQKFFIGLF